MASPVGVRLAYLRRFISDHGGEASFAGTTTADVCFEFVVPMTKPSGLSLVDHLANDSTTTAYVAPANWYVSHAWQYLFLETVNSLECFFADQGVLADAVIWFCVFNNNQHVAAQSFEHWSSTFKTSLAAIGNVVMIMHPWNDPIVLRRSWCVFEASETTVPSDRDGIFALIRAETSFIAVDRRLFSTLSPWIKTTLEASIAASRSPLEQAALSRHLGCVFDDEQLYADAERCHRRARDLYRQCLGDHHQETLLSQVRVAYAMGHQSKPRTEWELLLTATITAQASLLGDNHADVLAASFYHGDLSIICRHLGNAGPKVSV
ncbi:hypothetical protein SDRG_12105 [Saprolegnia diclina VS20]|uniref:Uncharacterized protein n=1 Tax=Saprolegnia diclina (strain VS20) TaxID=1156394 RepID=T0Q9U2_SAPDV|nr:hypothetical protein SDRG_12105 [Saprolegnia diclina VS20]EQC30255.1 hypothetical protein SDRG_12105 [Saprolegnia diclina VS20]|eukprot:XP_008616387.1 hypothetical protein SDRG_12105 [Saprolegnia diclina VS20]